MRNWCIRKVDSMIEWEPEPLETKAEAIAAGKEVYPCGFAIGQLRKTENKVYGVVNIEKLTFS